MTASFESPNLDDRTFQQLMDEAVARAKQACPSWTDFSPGDPGVTLLELFAFLTETLIYRLNRVPEKAYVEFLRLLGVRLAPPSSAAATLVFSRARAGDRPLVIPRGTRVTVSRTGAGAEPPVFTTDREVSIPAGATDVKVNAHHADLVEGELLGTSTGAPGQTFTVKRAPIIAPSGDELDFVLGVEAAAGELVDRKNAVSFGEKAYAIWREVENFGSTSPDSLAFVVDRATGRVTFGAGVRGARPGETAVRGLAAIPAAGRQIRCWYRCGGGVAGNVAAGMLTVLKDPIAGVTVTNPALATGGRAAETLQNALVRGPQEFRSLERAVTADDFELLAIRSSGAVSRAKASNLADTWAHAVPGTVEVVLVPAVPADAAPRGVVTRATLAERETEGARARIQEALDARRTLGTNCRVTWARYKAVTVTARVVIHREEDPEAIRRTLLERLHRAINPVSTSADHQGWRFGQPLRVSTVYDLALSEPGVKFADGVALVVDEVPAGAVTCLARDGHQPRTCFATAGDSLFRTGNDADGWERVGRFDGETVNVVETHEGMAGVVGCATSLGDADGSSRIRVSTDCGETWRVAAQFAFPVNDLAWMTRDQVPVLLMATEKGLYEIALKDGATPLQILVVDSAQDLGMTAVAVAVDPRGAVTVAVAARQTRGVFISGRGGEPKSFRPAPGLEGADIAALEVQRDGPRSFLWAGFSAEMGEEGRGCSRREIRASEDAPATWEPVAKGWSGGSCNALAFLPDAVVAATRRAGVLRLPAGPGGGAWEPCDINCGLPLRDKSRLHPVDAVAASPAGVVLAGGPVGVFRTQDGGKSWVARSTREHTDRVTIPENWLFCSGDHTLTVVSEDAAT